VSVSPGEKGAPTNNVRTIDAYFGEVMVRELGGRWVFNEQFRTVGVELRTGSVVFPHAKVAKRWEHGLGDSLVDLYEFASERSAPAN
jgi:hypothetical protein